MEAFSFGSEALPGVNDMAGAVGRGGVYYARGFVSSYDRCGNALTDRHCWHQNERGLCESAGLLFGKGGIGRGRRHVQPVNRRDTLSRWVLFLSGRFFLLWRVRCTRIVCVC